MPFSIDTLIVEQPKWQIFILAVGTRVLVFCPFTMLFAEADSLPNAVAQWLEEAHRKYPDAKFSCPRERLLKRKIYRSLGASSNSDSDLLVVDFSFAPHAVVVQPHTHLCGMTAAGKAWYEQSRATTLNGDALPLPDALADEAVMCTPIMKIDSKGSNEILL